ncbi:three-helix bundle dimerization domain-containing protein [Dactylosporangium cerinum]|uniref:Three-helix bundle dimerization domain-containing protein n=1 Tax=Dactylosporangium cerinum TaxID=1434730 RepID=A0ABV9VV35_9ACTN
MCGASSIRRRRRPGAEDKHPCWRDLRPLGHGTSSRESTIIGAAASNDASEHATQRLILRYAGRHDPEVVRQTVNQVTDLYATAEVHAFVPVFIERDARRILDEPND